MDSTEKKLLNKRRGRPATNPITILKHNLEDELKVHELSKGTSLEEINAKIDTWKKSDDYESEIIKVGQTFGLIPEIATNINLFNKKRTHSSKELPKTKNDTEMNSILTEIQTDSDEKTKETENKIIQTEEHKESEKRKRQELSDDSDDTDDGYTPSPIKKSSIALKTIEVPVEFNFITRLIKLPNCDSQLEIKKCYDYISVKFLSNSNPPWETRFWCHK